VTFYCLGCNSELEWPYVVLVCVNCLYVYVPHGPERCEVFYLPTKQWVASVRITGHTTAKAESN